jgi:hypothetical protein
MINLNDKTVEAVRQKANLAGKSPEDWAAEIVERNALPSPSKAWITKFLENARKVRGDSGGKTWTRDELYEE